MKSTNKTIELECESKKIVLLSQISPHPPSSSKKRTVATERPRIRRVVTETDRWKREFVSPNSGPGPGPAINVVIPTTSTISNTEGNIIVQKIQLQEEAKAYADAYICAAQLNPIVSSKASSIDFDLISSELVTQQIRTKISGYRSQDCEKGLFCENEFVCLQDVLDLIISSQAKCYYCQEPTMILYEFVREPKQWTLERLDNKYGHNRNNVVLACLRCNLRRRCMQSERYLKTKQMSVIVKTGK